MKTEAGRPVYLVVASQPADRDRLAELLPSHADADPLDPQSLTEIAPLVDACAAVVLLDGADGASAIRALVPLTQVRAGSSLLLIVRRWRGSGSSVLSQKFGVYRSRGSCLLDAHRGRRGRMQANFWDRTLGAGERRWRPVSDLPTATRLPPPRSEIIQ